MTTIQPEEYKISMAVEGYLATRARDLGFRNRGIGKRYNTADIQRFVSAAEQQAEANAPLVVAQRLEAYVPGFSETAFFKRVDELLRPPDASVPLKEANRLLDTTLQEEGVFIQTSSCTDEEEARIRRELSYTFKMDEAMKKGLVDPTVLSLFQTAWAVLSGKRETPRTIRFHISDMIYDGDGSNVSPAGAKYELSVYGLDYGFGDITLRVEPPSAELYVHSGSEPHYTDARNQLDTMFRSISRKPSVVNPLALSLTQTMVNPDLLAIGKREEYPNYFNIVNLPQRRAS